MPRQASATVNAPRWQEDDLGLAWIGNNVAIGDSGATILAGKELNNESVSGYGTGSGIPIFDDSVLGANNVRVAVAGRAPVAAALITSDLGGGVFQSKVQGYSTVGNGTPTFSMTLPSTGNVIAGVVAVTDDGARIVAAVSNASGQQHLRVYSLTGTLLQSWDVAAAANIRAGAIDATGDRLYLGLFNGTCEIYDLNTGALLHSHSLGGTFDSHAFSADGKTFAYGNFSGLFVVRETVPGTWSQVAARTHAGGQYLGRCAISADGDTVAFGVQRYTPNYDHLELGGFDVASGSDLFSASVDAPGTTLQLISSACAVSADGEQLAFGTWGDDQAVTATIQAYDRSGTQTAAITTPGSVFAIALDQDGDVLAAGSKAVHANTSGNGGSVWCVDAAEQTLHLLGDAQVGGSLSLESPAGANTLTLAIAGALGASPSAFGTTEIDLGTLINTVGPLTIGAGGLTHPLNVPPSPGLAGVAVHFQGLRSGPGFADLTNKVSLRLRP